MTPMLKVVARVIKRHMDEGQAFDDIIKAYPKLTTKEIELLREELAV